MTGRPIFFNEASLYLLRGRLALAFAPDTAAAGFSQSVPSSGHCAAVAVIVHGLLGGELVSTKVDGQSHWFNRLPVDGGYLDVDLTGDQFGRAELQISAVGTLYPDTRVRALEELKKETTDRARLLAKRAGVALS